jgi:valyl-tRNA synthetase
MLGDTAVAVHPEDERYRRPRRPPRRPAAGRPADSDRRRQLLRPGEGHGCRQDHAGPRFQRLRGRPAARPRGDPDSRRAGPDQRERAGGLSRPRPVRGAKARRRRPRGPGAAAKVEPYRHTVPHGDRSQTPLEPYLTDQWYCDAATLAKPAIEAVETGRTKSSCPAQWQNTYFEWMRNIQPWCISRQLWWGHRIPAWYGRTAPSSSRRPRRRPSPRRRRISATTSSSARPRRPRHLVLLGPVAVLDPRLARRDPGARALLPGHVLVTGFDIIFFWVAG